MIDLPPLPRRALLCGGALTLGGGALALSGCFGRSFYDENPDQKGFLAGLQALARPALSSGNPLKVEEAAKQSLLLGEKLGSFKDWNGVLKSVEGNAQNVTVTVEVGPQVTLYAFNDWTLGVAGSIASTVSDIFSSRTRPVAPPGLSEAAVAALKTFRLGEKVKLSGKMGDIAGSGLFDISSWLGKGDSDHREFLQAPRFLASIEAIATAPRLRL